jgi:beta-lactamase regulating signal transducer with metallopeptidase domain
MTLSWFESPSGAALLEALLHTLWQGALAAALVALALWLLPGSRHGLRHAACLAGLLLVAAGWIATWAWLDEARAAGPATLPSPVPAAVSPDHPPAGTAPEFADRAAAAPPASAPFRMRNVLGSIWMLGVALGLARLAAALRAAGGLKRRAAPLGDPALLEAFETIRARLGIRARVLLMESAELAVPAVYGLLHPVVLLPSGLTERLSPDVLKAVLAHELAHLRRWDAWINLAQLALEALLFFNPFVWWISFLLRNEREACSDALAASLGSDETWYAAALADYAADLHARAFPPLLLGMGGTGPGWKDRMARLLFPAYRPGIRLGTAGLLLGLALLASGLWLLKSGSGFLARQWTGKERLAYVAALQKEFPPPAVLQEDAPEREGKLALTGRIVDALGNPVPQAGVVVNSNAPRSSYTACAQTGADGRYALEVPFGRIRLGVCKEAFAPVFAEIPVPADGNKAEAPDVVLPPGFSAALKIVDEAGSPLAGVPLSFRYSGPPDIGHGQATSDALGLAVFSHAASLPMAVDIVYPGYEQMRSREAKLQEQAPTTLVLRKAVPLRVRILSRKTGQAVPGAWVYLANSQSQTGGWSNVIPEQAPDPEKLLARGDGNGNALITTLSRDAVHGLLIGAPGHAAIARDGVITGTDALEVFLPEENRMDFEVVNAGGAAGPQGKLAVGWSQMLQFGNTSYATRGGLKEEPEVREGVARFSVVFPFAAETKLYLGSQEVGVEASPDGSGVRRIDLAALPSALKTETAAAEREVHVVFKTPDRSLSPEGTLHVDYIGSHNTWRQESVPIRGGLAAFRAPVGAKLEFKPTGLTGYGFAPGEEATCRVEPGSGPQPFTLACFPAGSLYGEVREANGDPARNILISVVQAARDSGKTLGVDVKNRSSGDDATYRFTATPLPLGETYQIIAYRNFTYAAGPAVRLTGEAPIARSDVVLPAGQRVVLTVTDESGHPIPGVKATFSLELEDARHGFSRDAFMTSGVGEIVLDALNFDIPGHYSLELSPPRGFQPRRILLEKGKPHQQAVLEKGEVLEGIAVDKKTGQPLANREVTARRDKYEPLTAGLVFRAEAPTGPDGHFRFSTLPEDDVTIWVEGARGAGTKSRAGQAGLRVEAGL